MANRRSRVSLPAVVAVGAGVGLAGVSALRRLREADLRGQAALITGGSRGLGFLLAREFGRAGCRVAICARDPQELHEAQGDLQREGIEALAVRCDVSERAQVERMVSDVAERLGPIDVLVNNAGIIQVGPAQQMQLQDFEAALGAMFWGPVYTTLAVLPSMRARNSGRIVNITSIGGKVSVPHLLPYTAAKFAATGFSEGLRAELAQDGVTVTTIAPGLMRTGSHLNATFKGRLNREFTWMSLLASLPGISMDAERAARQIVRATKRGEAERVLSAPARLLAIFHGVMPGTTSNLLGLVNRVVLPEPGGHSGEPVAGMIVDRDSPSQVRDALTAMGRDAAERFHEFSGEAALAIGRTGPRERNGTG